MKKKKKIDKKEQEFYHIQNIIVEDLRKFTNKWSKHNYKFDENNSLAFYMQMKFAMHELLSRECIHTFKDMVDHLQKEVIDFEKRRLAEDEEEVMTVNTKH